MTIKASRQSRKGTVVQQDYHRRSPCGLRHVQSAFRPVVGQRGLIPFVPRAGPLERNLRDQSARDEEINRCSQTLCVSLSTLQNAITTSSCSPAGGLPQPHRNLPAKTHIQLPRCSSKELKENGFQSLCLIPHVSKKIEYEKVADTTPRQVKFLRNCLHTTRRGRSGKRKNPLLPHRRECLILPPPLKLGYRVTAEHLDQEKETVFRRINCALRGKFLISQNSNAVQPFCSPSLPASGTAPPPTVPTVPSKMAGKRKCIVEQDTLGPGALQASAAVTTSMHPGSGRKSTSATCPSSSEALPGSSSHSMATASGSSLTAVPSLAACKDDLRSATPVMPGPSAGEAIPHRKGKRKSNWEPPLYGENPGPLSPRTSERATAIFQTLPLPRVTAAQPAHLQPWPPCQ
ncbi:putative POM121-like protein 1 [Heterocephalus glaber]|uniref:POM121-like protein 1 n=1 Tax=Heterocephalus glaber TaxID=10181 RepID=A0AAX6T0D6_HETGA|nr:putative POM121-like protein 1 [Heterocephalus glaber]